MSDLERFIRDEDTLREIARIRRAASEQAARQSLLDPAAWGPSFQDPSAGYWVGRLSALLRQLLSAARRPRRA